jgi:dihydroflavonol-4-reductase
LVTGATGCVGANVVAALIARGYEVRAMVRCSSTLTALDGLDPELAEGDVLDPVTLSAAADGCDLVFHIAAVSDYWRSSRARIYDVNVEGTRNALQAALENGVERLVYTSSIGALGLPEPGCLLDESNVFNLPPRRFPYGHSKYLAEQLVQDATASGLDAVIVNLTAVLGARDVNFIGGSLLREAKRGLTWVTFPGSLNWIDAQTCGDGHVLAAERGRTGRRYILGGENISHRRAMEIAAEVVGGRHPLVTLPRAMLASAAVVIDLFNALWPGTPVFSGDQARMSAETVCADCGRAQRELGLPIVSFRSAAERAYGWYLDHGLL